FQFVCIPHSAAEFAEILSEHHRTLLPRDQWKWYGLRRYAGRGHGARACRKTDACAKALGRKQLTQGAASVDDARGEINLRQDDPTAKVKPVRTNSGGIHSWTEAEIAQFEARHQVGTKARLALALLLGTGQRVSDVIRMGRQHIRDGFIHVRQQKTGAELDIEIPPELAAILADTPTNDMTFLMAQPGRPFTPGYFCARFSDHCTY